MTPQWRQQRQGAAWEEREEEEQEEKEGEQREQSKACRKISVEPMKVEGG